MAQTIPTDELLFAILDELTVITDDIKGKGKEKDKDSDSGGKDEDKPSEVTFKVEGNEEIVALLTGMASLDADKLKSMEELNKNVESLCNSVKALAQVNVKELKESVITVQDLMKNLSEIKMDDQQTMNIATSAEALSRIQSKLVKIAETMSTIDVKSGVAAMQSICQILSVVSAFKVEDKHVDNAKELIETIGSIGEKIKSINESLQKVKIDKDSLTSFRELISVLDSINKMEANGGGFASLSKVFNPIAALKIWFFMKTMSKLNKSKLNADAMVAVAILLRICVDIGKHAKVMKKVPEALKHLEKVDPKNASRVGDYFYKFMKPFTELDDKDINKFVKVVKILRESLFYVIGAIAIMMTLAIIDMPALIVATGLLVGSLWMMTTFLLKLSKNIKGITEGSKTVKALSSSLLMISTTVGIMALILKTFDLGTIALGIIIVIGILWVVTKMAISLGKKGKDLKYGKTAISQVADALLKVVAAIAIIALMQKIFDLGEIIAGTVIVIGIMAALVGLTKWLASGDDKAMNKAVKNMNQLCIALLEVTAAIAIMTLLAKMDLMSTIIGAGIVVLLMYIMISMVKKLAKIEDKSLKHAIKALNSLTIMLTVVSLLALLVFPGIAKQAGDVLIGSVIVLGIIALMGLMVWGLSAIKSTDLAGAVTALGVLTVCLLAVSLIALFILPPIGEKWKDVAKGAVVVMGIIGLMALTVALMSFIKKDNLLVAVGALAVMTVCFMAISLIASEILVPLGYEWEDAAKGGAVVMGVIALMTLCVWGLSAMKKETMLYGVGAMVVMALIVWGISEIVDRYFIPIGMVWEEAAKGGAVVIGTIALMGAILVGIAKFLDNPKEKPGTGYDGIIKAVIIIGAVVGLLWAIGELMPPFTDLAIDIGQNIDTYAAGAAGILTLLAGFGAIIYWVGDKASDKKFLMAMAKGAGIIAGIGAVLWVLGEILPPYIELAVNVYNNAEAVAAGSGIIAAILAGWGLLMAGIGALVTNPIVALVLLVGAATITGIAGVMWILDKGITAYAHIIKTVENSKGIDKKDKIVTGTIKSMMEVLKAVGKMVLNPFTALCIGAGIPALIGVSAAMRALKSSILDYMMLTAIMKQFSTEDMEKFRDFIVDEKKGFIGTVNTICKKFEELGASSALKAMVIATAIRPIFSSIKDFMTIIDAFSKMKYPTEFDEKGKPIKFAPMNSEYFIKAAISISTCFTIFLTQLGKSMEAWDFKKAFVLMMLSKNLEPVIKSVGTFVDAVLKLTAGTIPIEWDKEGKAIKFRQVTANDFVQAALAVTFGFSMFLSTLGPALEKLGPWSLICIKSLADGIEPVMTAVGTFANTIMDVLVGKDFEIPDPNDASKTIKKHLTFDAANFAQAALIISDAFTTFLSTLYEGLKEFDYSAGDKIINKIVSGDSSSNKVGSLLSSLSGIEEIVNTVGKLCDLCVKMGEHMETVDLPGVAKIMASTMTDFLSSLTSTLGQESYKEILEFMLDNTKKANSVVVTFSTVMNNLKAIHKNIEGTYLDCAEMYKTMINALIGSDIQASYKAADKMLDETIMPLMEKYAKVINFFAKLELATSNVKYKMSAKAIKKNAEMMTDVVNGFASALEHYTAGCENVDYGVFIKLGQSIGDMYDMVRNEYSRFNYKFNSLTKVFAQAVRRQFEPQMRKVISLLNTVYKSWSRLDDILIKKERKRNEALKKLKTHIDNIASSTDNLANALKSVAANSDALTEAQNKLNAAQTANAAVAAGQASAAAGNKATGNGAVADTPTQNTGHTGFKPLHLDRSKYAGVDSNMLAVIEAMGNFIAEAFINSFDGKQIAFNSSGNQKLFVGTMQAK